MDQRYHYNNATNAMGSRLLSMLIFVIVIVTFIYQCTAIFKPAVNPDLRWSTFSFSMLTIISIAIYLYNPRKNTLISFTSIYLISTLSLMIAWRLSVYINNPVGKWLFFSAFILKVINYLYASYQSIMQARQQGSQVDLAAVCLEWQLLTIRLYIGFAIYLLVASILGSHFDLGFIWASKGGGWEYPVLWIVLVLTFSVFGAQGFSLDHILLERFRVPRFIRWMMGTTMHKPKSSM